MEYQKLGSSDVSVSRMQHVERLGQQWGEVFVIGVARDLSSVATRAPQLGRSGRGECRRADFQCEVHPQSFHRHAKIVELTPPFGRLSRDAGRCVTQYDRRFGLVPMLSARTSPSRMRDVALAQQLLGGKQHGVKDDGWHVGQ